jgi:hypothetical protein
MKTKLIALALFCFAPIAHATLIDLTPGGFSELNTPPNVAFVFGLPFLAGANINGNTVNWSPFVPFGPNEFSITPLGANAIISWDLSLTNGQLFQYLLLEAANLQANIYHVSPPEMIDGTGFVTIDDFSTIQAIIFIGTNAIIPETGATIFTFVLALSLIFGFSRFGSGHRLFYPLR